MGSDTCRSCSASIRWALTTKGRRIPLDPDPVPDGNLVLVDGVAYSLPALATLRPELEVPAERFVSHFATCPQAGDHRGRKRGDA